jgi:2-oxoglutarate ferredoxin oxidoreductase subunit beta
MILSRMFDEPGLPGAMPRPFGVLYAVERPVYEGMLDAQVRQAMAIPGVSDPLEALDALIAGNETWTIA